MATWIHLHIVAKHGCYSLKIITLIGNVLFLIYRIYVFILHVIIFFSAIFKKKYFNNEYVIIWFAVNFTLLRYYKIKRNTVLYVLLTCSS